ncbi:MAG: hypothetical protein K5669_09980 [Lachnospiraceae bacterium]|nr:hypothetical protein [Lachnospiraceae bacterium]
MRKCPYCKIEVGGDLSKCPICQSKLMGEPEKAYFPKPITQQRRSDFYKIQSFVVWVIAIVGLSAEYLLHIKIPAFPKVQWSLLLIMWLAAFEFLVMRQFKPGTGHARKVTSMVFVILILLLVTTHFLNFEIFNMTLFEITSEWVVPLAIIGSIITNFVFAMIDKNGNTMSYLLTNLLVGVIPYIILYSMGKGTPIAWIACVVLSIIFFIGAITFKGRTVLAEVQRRFNL